MLTHAVPCNEEVQSRAKHHTFFSPPLLMSSTQDLSLPKNKKTVKMSKCGPIQQKTVTRTNADKSYCRNTEHLLGMFIRRWVVSVICSKENGKFVPTTFTEEIFANGHENIVVATAYQQQYQ